MSKKKTIWFCSNCKLTWAKKKYNEIEKKKFFCVCRECNSIAIELKKHRCFCKKCKRKFFFQVSQKKILPKCRECGEIVFYKNYLLHNKSIN